MHKREKRGIVLFITILLLLFMSSIVMIFLKNSDFLQRDVLLERATIQSNILVKKIIDYIKEYEIKEEELKYLSKVKMPLSLNETTILIGINSKQSKPSLNGLIKKFQTDRNSKDYYQFLDFIGSYNLKSPDYLIDVLIDSVDSDHLELASGSQSEIALLNPKFQNGDITTTQRLDEIFSHYKRYYDDENSDKLLEEFKKVFSLSNHQVDINFLNKEALKFLLPHESEVKLEELEQELSVYEDFSKLPLSDDSKSKLSSGTMANSFIFKSEVALITIEIENNFFKSSTSFDYYLSSKTAKDLTIQYIQLK